MEPSRALQNPPKPPSTCHVAPVASTAAAATAAATTTTPSSGFTSQHRKPKAKRKRKGWGPFQSVTKERSVDFNLTLDIQSLNQEIQQLLTARELLQSRSLQRRQSPTGSLMQTVREFLRLFRQGFPVQRQRQQQQHWAKRHVITTGERREFLVSVIDPEIDFGGGNCGVEFMIEQIRRYCLVWRFIAMEMDQFEIMELDDDNVMIKTTGTWRIQILRESVVAMFPHVEGNEWLLARLIGATVAVPTALVFQFNSRDRICRYEPDADFVAAFSSVLMNPDDVAELLGQARIGEHSTIRAEDNDVDNRPLSTDHRLPRRERPTLQYNDAQYDRQESLTAAPPRRELSSFRDYLAIVDQYVAALTNSIDSKDWQSPLRVFLDRFVSPSVSCGRSGGHTVIEQRWRAVWSRFAVLGVRAVAVSPPQTIDGSTVSVCVQLTYDLQIVDSTIQRVFPHVLRIPSLTQDLLGGEITCPNELEFQWNGHAITRIDEQLDWHTALTPLLPHASDRAFVLRGALLSNEGDTDAYV